MAETKTEKANPLKVYEVVASAVTMRVGRLRGDVRRFVRGELLELDPTHATTRLFVRGAALVEHDPSKKAPRATPRIVARAWGAEEDPVAMATPRPATAQEIEETQ